MKIFRKKSTKEYLVYQSREFYLAEIPYLHPDSVSCEGIKSYAKEYDKRELDITDVECLEVTLNIVESNSDNGKKEDHI